MIKIKSLFVGLLLGAFFIGAGSAPGLAQGGIGQLGPGQVYANAGAVKALGAPVLLDPLLTRNFCGTASNFLANIGGTWQCASVATGLSFTGSVFGVTTNGISNAMLRQGGALSLIGRSANSLGNVADISATPGSSCVFQETASTLACAAIATASITNNAVTFAKFQQLAALSMFGNCTNALANGGNVTGTANQVLRVDSAGTTCGFGSINLASASAVTGTLITGSIPAFAGGQVTSPGGSLVLTIGAGQVTYAMMATAAIATSAQYLAGTASELVNSGAIYPAEVAITFGATQNIDFSTFINASITMTANTTTQNVSNVMAGKSGQIAFIQSGAGSFTTVWNSVFKFAGGVTPALTTGSTTAVDILSFSCRSATNCPATLLKDVR